VFKHILFPTDGTELSRKAQAAALGLAKSLGARVTAIHSIEPYTPQVTDLTFVYADPVPPEEYLAAARQASAAILARFLAEAKEAGVACDALDEVASAPWNAIVKAAEESHCDVIVMASHGRRGIAGVLLGSETQKVLTHSPVPVLVYR
jgi:nucleotide-binding universal stress UspA family protein